MKHILLLSLLSALLGSLLVSSCDSGWDDDDKENKTIVEYIKMKGTVNGKSVDAKIKYGETNLVINATSKNNWPKKLWCTVYEVGYQDTTGTFTIEFNMDDIRRGYNYFADSTAASNFDSTFCHFYLSHSRMYRPYYEMFTKHIDPPAFVITDIKQKWYDNSEANETGKKRLFFYITGELKGTFLQEYIPSYKSDTLRVDLDIEIFTSEGSIMMD